MSDSIWKKEISFKRKPRVDAGDVEPAAGEPKQSLLKKEISFRRKPRPEVDDAAPKESIWKKDISLARKTREREIERLAEEAARAVAADVPVPAYEQPTERAEAVVAAMPDPVASLQPAVLDLGPPPELPAELYAVPAPEAAPPVDLGPPPELPAELHAVPSVEPEPAAGFVEPWLADAELPPETVTLHPPVPEAELPPIPEAEPKVPFWKRDLALSRKPKLARPKAERGTPFWKKELSLGRGKAAADPDEFELPKRKSAPFWKRELSLPTPSLPSRPRGRKVQRLVGLKIGASQLAAARIANNGVAELQQLAREPLLSGVVVAGELRDPEALGDALKLFFARHKLPKKNVRLGLASNRIGVRILDIVGVEEHKQLANAVQFRAQEALPIPLDEAVLDFRVLDESVDAEGRTVKRVLLVVAYRELIDRYVGACRKAGIVLAGIDLEAFALLRALGAPADREGSALVAIAIGHERSTFAVSDGRTCEFTRVVEWGGSSLNVALARVLDSTPSEVETLKKTLSLDGSWSPAGLTTEQAAAALDAVRRQIQSFARELVSSLQFYQNQPGSLGIGEIVITGGTAQLPGLAAELEGLIGVHVRIGDPLARLKVAKRVTAGENVGSLAVAIGLGIED